MKPRQPLSPGALFLLTDLMPWLVFCWQAAHSGLRVGQIYHQVGATDMYALRQHHRDVLFVAVVLGGDLD